MRHLLRSALAVSLSVLLAACAEDATGPELTQVTLSPNTVQLTAVNGTASLSATVVTNASPVTNPVVAWKSSATAVVTVAGTGATAMLTAVGEGAATITATSGGVDAIAQVSVILPRPLAVTMAGAGIGAVASSPAGITGCTRSSNTTTGTCSAMFAPGVTVTLTPTAGGNSSFDGWSGACSGIGNCVVAMDQAKAVTATFSLVPQPLAVSIGGTGAGSIASSPAGISCTRASGVTTGACGASFFFGNTVTLTPTPATGSTFTGWSGGACTGTANCSVTMDQARSVTATFTLVAQTLTVTTAGTGAGSVGASSGGIACARSGGATSGTCTTDLAFGTPVALTATAAAGSAFTGWTGACIGSGPCNVTMDQAKSVTATFALITNTLTVTPAGAGDGTVTSSPSGVNCTRTLQSNLGVCSSAFVANSTVALTASAANGFSFGGWSGACSGTGVCAVTLDDARAVTATFTLLPQSVTVTAAGAGTGIVTSTPAGITCARSGGTTTGNCTSTFAFGSTVSLSATGATGSAFAGWSGACSGLGVCTVTADQARNVTATFTLDTRLLITSINGTGGGAVVSTPSGINCTYTRGGQLGACGSEFASGAAVTLTATPAGPPAPRTIFTGWGGACSGTGACVVTMDQARSVTATFDEPCFALPITLGSSAAVPVAPLSCRFGTFFVVLHSYTLATQTTFQITVTPSAGTSSVTTPFVTDAGGVFWFNQSTPALANVIAAPGTYRMLSGQDGAPGTYTLTTTLNPALTCEFTFVSFGVTISANLFIPPTCFAYTPSGLGTTSQRQLLIGVPAGKTLRVTLTSTAFSPVIEFANGAGAVLATTAVDAPSSTAVLTFTPAGSTSIRVIVTTRTPGGSGAYTVVIDP